MNIVILSKLGYTAQLAYLAKQEGHSVSLYIVKPYYRTIWQGVDLGLCKKMPDVKKADLILFDSVGGGQTAERLRSQGKKIVGSSLFSDTLCADNEFSNLSLLGTVTSYVPILDEVSQSGVWLVPKRDPLYLEVFKCTKQLTKGYGKSIGCELSFVKLVETNCWQADIENLRRQNAFGLFLRDSFKCECELSDVFFALCKLVGWQYLILGSELNLEKAKVACSIRVSTDPYPYSLTREHTFKPVGLSREDLFQHWLYSIQVRQGEVVTNGLLGAWLGAGSSCQEAFDSATSQLPSLEGLQLRYDLDFVRLASEHLENFPILVSEESTSSESDISQEDDQTNSDDTLCPEVVSCRHIDDSL